MSQERNSEICRRYIEEDKTQEDLAIEYALSKPRIGQILRENGVMRNDRTGPPRTATIGVALRPEVKIALEEITISEGSSISKFVSNLIEEELQLRGVKMLPVHDDPKLPLEG